MARPSKGNLWGRLKAIDRLTSGNMSLMELNRLMEPEETMAL